MGSYSNLLPPALLTGCDFLSLTTSHHYKFPHITLQTCIFQRYSLGCLADTHKKYIKNVWMVVLDNDRKRILILFSIKNLLHFLLYFMITPVSSMPSTWAN